MAEVQNTFKNEKTSSSSPMYWNQIIIGILHGLHFIKSKPFSTVLMLAAWSGYLSV